MGKTKRTAKTAAILINLCFLLILLDGHSIDVVTFLLLLVINLSTVSRI